MIKKVVPLGRLHRGLADLRLPQMWVTRVEWTHHNVHLFPFLTISSNYDLCLGLLVLISPCLWPWVDAHLLSHVTISCCCAQRAVWAVPRAGCGHATWQGRSADESLEPGPVRSCRRGDNRFFLKLKLCVSRDLCFFWLKFVLWFWILPRNKWLRVYY